MSDTYHRMIVGKSVVDSHVLEKIPNVLLKEPFHFPKVKLRINENGSNVRLDYVRKAL